MWATGEVQREEKAQALLSLKRFLKDHVRRSTDKQLICVLISVKDRVAPLLLEFL